MKACQVKRDSSEGNSKEHFVEEDTEEEGYDHCLKDSRLVPYQVLEIEVSLEVFMH